MYEKTIGSYNLIYQITLTGTPTLVRDLLTPSDLDELNTYLIVNGKEDKHVVDGYIKCGATFYISHKNGGAEEDVAAGERYPLPVYKWLDYVYIRGAAPATVRILLSKV